MFPCHIYYGPLLQYLRIGAVFFQIFPSPAHHLFATYIPRQKVASRSAEHRVHHLIQFSVDLILDLIDTFRFYMGAARFKRL